MNEIIREGKAPQVIFTSYDLLDDATKSLLVQAIGAREIGNQPISKFHVGAAIEVKKHPANKIYTGSNYENVNYNGSTHAEQDAINRALSDRSDKLQYDNIQLNKLAIVGGMRDLKFDKTQFTIKTQEDIMKAIQNKDLKEIMKEFITPCGHCRQIYATFLHPKTEVILLNYKGMVAKIKDAETLMPFAFSKIG